MTVVKDPPSKLASKLVTPTLSVPTKEKFADELLVKVAGFAVMVVSGGVVSAIVTAAVALASLTPLIGEPVTSPGVPSALSTV